MKIRHVIFPAIPAFRGLAAFLCIAPVLHAVPLVTTNPATALGTGTATLNGAVVAGDAAAEVYFEWGLDPSLVTSVSTLAGTGEQGSRDGLGSVATFYNPLGLAVDAAGVVYVADTGSGKIRKIHPNQVVTTLGTGGLNAPVGIDVAAGGIVYVAEAGGNRISKLAADGTLSFLAGSGLAGNADGAGLAASFSSPAGLAVDGAGNVIVADRDNHRIRKVTPSGFVSTLTGQASGGSSWPWEGGFADGPAALAQFSFPLDVAIGLAGEIYVADSYTARIRRLSPDGLVSTFAGSGTYDFADGAGNVAGFAYLTSLAVGTEGTLFAADWEAHRVRKISPDAVVSTLAGTGQMSVVDGPVGIAQFYSPNAVAVDAAGVVYVADSLAHRIRKIAAPGHTSSQSVPEGASSVAVARTLSGLLPGRIYYYRAVAVAAGESFTGQILSFTAPNTAPVITGLSDVTVKESSISTRYPAGPFAFEISDAESTADSLFVTLSSSNLELASPRVATVSGTGGSRTVTVSPVPYRYGTAVITITVSDGLLTTSTSFQVTVTAVNDPPNMFPITTPEPRPANSPPFSVALAGLGPGPLETGVDTLSVTAASDNPSLVPDPVVEYANPNSVGRLTLVPAANKTGLANISVTVDDGAGATNSRLTKTFVVKIYPPVTSLPATAVRSRSATLWGSLNPYSNPARAWFESSTHPTLATTMKTIPGTERDILGPLPNLGDNAATAYMPDGICVDREGTIYTADNINHQIRRISQSGLVSIVAGIPQPGMVDAVGEAARFAYPAGVAVDAMGNLYVADSENHRVRKINSGGMVTTLAGSSPGGFADGLGGQAKFNRPFGVAVDGGGNVFVADTGNNRIRRITPAGLVSTIAGSGQGGFADGPAEAAMFDHPDGVAVDANGSVCVADTFNRRVRLISPLGVVSTLAGSAQGGSPEGTGAEARLSGPVGVAVDSGGNLVISDTNWSSNTPSAIRRVSPWGKVTALVGGDPPFVVLDIDPKYARVNSPTGVAVGPDGRIFINDGYFRSVREIVPRFTTAYQTGLTGSSPLAVSSALTGLLPGTTYYYRAVGENSGGPGTGEILSFTTLTALAEWRLDTLGAVDAPLDADGDGDGLTNLVEYALSRDPRQPDRTPLPGPVRDGGGLVWTIPKVAGVLYNVESSPDLTAGSWSSAGLNIELDSASLLKVRAAMTADTQRFFRIRVSVAP